MDTEMEVEREEGEMSDDEMYVEDIAQSCIDEANKHALLYKRDKNGLTVQELEKVDAFKLEERAKRFGFSLTGNRVITQKQIDLLYHNFGVKDGNERHFRFDTLHLFGVDGLSTKDIFEYLEDYKPVAIEWIDDKSCNIVCQDHISVALALLVHSREIMNENLNEMLHEKSSHHWREGLPHPKKELILLRFATNSDKKMSKMSDNKIKFEELDKHTHSDTKNPWGDLCMSWGVYDHQEVFQHTLSQDFEDEDKTELIKKVEKKNKRLALRLGKKNRKIIDSDESSSDSEWKRKSKTPRMRMHADDVECKNVNMPVNNSDEECPYAPLSIEVINTKSIYTPRTALKLSEKFRSSSKYSKSLEKNSIQSRLGTKMISKQDDSFSDESTSDHFDCNITSKIQTVTKGGSSSGSVWSRLELKSDNKNTHKDLRQKLKSRKQKKTDDLRDVLSKTKQSNLRIEVDNNYVNK